MSFCVTTLLCITIYLTNGHLHGHDHHYENATKHKHRYEDIDTYPEYTQIHKKILRWGKTKYIDDEIIDYYVTEDGNWHLDSCSIIGNEKNGLALRSSMIRRLNPYDSIEEWPGRVVPYAPHPDFTTFDSVRFEAAVEEYNTYSSIRWRTKIASDEHWVEIIGTNGCVSYIGDVRSFTSPQSLSLGPGCQNFNTIVHEMGHAIGMYHSQSRSDRDDWVIINIDNVLDGLESNFAKHDNKPVCGCYDCASIMHYSEYAFSKNGERTVTPINPDTCDITRNGLSTGDKDCLEILYPTGKPAFNPATCPTNYPTAVTQIPTKSSDTPSTVPTKSPLPTTNSPTSSPTIPTIAPTNSPVTHLDPMCLSNGNTLYNGGYVYDGQYNGYASYKGPSRVRSICVDNEYYIWSTTGDNNRWQLSTLKGAGSTYLICNELGLNHFQDCHGRTSTNGLIITNNVEICPQTQCPSIKITGDFPIPCQGYFEKVDDNIYEGSSNGYVFYYDDHYRRWICGTNVPEACEYGDFYGYSYNRGIHNMNNLREFGNIIQIPWYSASAPTLWANDGSNNIMVSCQLIPTQNPTELSKAPTLPTILPTFSPSDTTISPTAPTIHPTNNPTIPTISPTDRPTLSPTLPTIQPTYSPTLQPTKNTSTPTSRTSPNTQWHNLQTHEQFLWVIVVVFFGLSIAGFIVYTMFCVKKKDSTNANKLKNLNNAIANNTTIVPKNSNKKHRVSTKPILINGEANQSVVAETPEEHETEYDMGYDVGYNDPDYNDTTYNNTAYNDLNYNETYDDYYGETNVATDVGNVGTGGLPKPVVNETGVYSSTLVKPSTLKKNTTKNNKKKDSNSNKVNNKKPSPPKAKSQAKSKPKPKPKPKPKTKSKSKPKPPGNKKTGTKKKQ